MAAVLKAARGLDLAGYKGRWAARRIALRVRARGCPDPAGYAALLGQDPDEADRLVRALTVSVSQFFRNPTTFTRMAEVVFPPLFERARPGGVTIWSIGCASGEEPYSVAMLLWDRFAAGLARTRVRIRGFDRDEAALGRARGAVYDRARIADVPAALRGRCFRPRPDGRVEVDREVRGMVAFRRIDVLAPRGLPPGPVHLILCRNVLIYFTRGEQERLLARFAERLVDGGFLVLGRAETLVGADRRRFETVCPWERIYRRP